MAFSVIRSLSFSNGYAQSTVLEILLDSAEDVDDLPTDCSPGSFAYTANMDHAWQMSPSHEWIPLVGG